MTCSELWDTQNNYTFCPGNEYTLNQKKYVLAEVKPKETSSRFVLFLLRKKIQKYNIDYFLA